MPPKPVDAGKSFLEQVLARVPDDRRAGLETAAAAILADEALLTGIGEGVLLRSDYSREMNRLQEIETKQTEWWNANQAVLEKARKAGITPTSSEPALVPDDPSLKPAAGVTLDDVNKLIEQREAGVVPFVGAVATLAIKHYQTFGEVLDTDAILRDATAKKITLDAAYQTAHGERLKTKAAEQENARIDKIVNDRLIEARRNERSRPPDTMSGGSPLDVLEPAKAGVGVDELVDLYEAEVQKSRVNA